jgi:hypothetical protein
MCEVAIRCDEGGFLTMALLGQSHPGIGPPSPGRSRNCRYHLAASR